MCSWNQDKDMGGNQVELPTPDILRDVHDRDTVCIDSYIVTQMQALWNSGIVTLGCCCGHGKELPSVILASGANLADQLRAYRVLSTCDTRQWRIYQWKLVQLEVTNPALGDP